MVNSWWVMRKNNIEIWAFDWCFGCHLLWEEGCWSQRSLWFVARPRLNAHVASFIGSFGTNKYIIKVFTDKHAFLLFRHSEGQDIKAELKDHDNMETSLNFSKAVSFLNISAERNQLGRNLRSTTLATEHDPRDLVNTFLNSIGYGFVDDLIEEIKERMLDDWW